MKVAAFDFDLPERLIALRPAEPREAARMLVVRADRTLEDRHMTDFPQFLSPGDVVVFNDTRVIPARLAGRRGEVKIGVTLHRREDPLGWRAFARPAKRLKAGDRIAFAAGLSATVVAKGEGGEITLRFDGIGPDLAAAIERHGAMPIPPYIARRRAPDVRDREDYQTVYARASGAVAAPTAGLHFSRGLLQGIDEAGAQRVTLTLHVGAGTFLPVKAEDTADHHMHAEWGRITPEAAAAVNDARARGCRVVAVGTTSLRLLETAATAEGILEPFEGETEIFITPGYRFRIVDMLVTNFHLPRSTLFMLVAAFAGLDETKRAYAHAIADEYRFYSYGDASLIYRKAA